MCYKLYFRVYGVTHTTYLMRWTTCLARWPPAPHIDHLHHVLASRLTHEEVEKSSKQKGMSLPSGLRYASRKGDISENWYFGWNI